MVYGVYLLPLERNVHLFLFRSDSLFIFLSFRLFIYLLLVSVEMLSLRKMHSKRKSRSTDNFLCIKDSESLDSCISGVLSSLYPPFISTAPTLLWQLFSVVERQYHGDGLRCLLDYLLPAKSILHSLQQHSRERFKGVPLCHVGWPLCLQEKVVVQLSPLHKVRLRPGDFYLQLVPQGRRSARLVLKCLASSGRAVAELPVPEGMIARVFTLRFPDEITRGRNLPPLTSCLLSAAAGDAVFRTPWKNVAVPLQLTGGWPPASSCTVVLPPLFSGVPAVIPAAPRFHGSTAPRDSLQSDASALETRRLFRQSYMEALQNPMSLGCSSESVLDEGHNPRQPPLRQLLPRRLCGRGGLRGLDLGWAERDQNQNRNESQQNLQQRPRSKSLERTGLGAGLGRAAQASLSCMLLLVDKECVYRPERELSIPCELLTSLKSLQKHVDPSQLTQDLDGTFPYDHAHYVSFREKIEPFASSCSEAVTSLQTSISSLNNTGSLDTTQAVMKVIEERRRLMKCVLDDVKLNRLRLEGGTFLARIRKEELCDNHIYRAAVDMVCALYNLVDEEVHRLVIQSNASLQHLEELLQTHRFEEATVQIKHWFTEKGEKHLASLDSYCLSSASITQLRRDLDDFMDQSDRQQKQAQLLVQSAEGCPSPTLMDFKRFLSAMTTRSERRKADLETLQNLYEFYDSAERWLACCAECVQLGGDEWECGVALQEVREEGRGFSHEHFSTMREAAEGLGLARVGERCSALWRRCQVAHAQLEDALTHSSTAPPDGDQRDCSHTPPQLSPLGASPERTSSFLFDPLYTPTGSASSSPSHSHFLFPPVDGRAGDSSGASPFDDTDSDCTVDSFVSSRSEPPMRSAANAASAASAASTAARLRKPPLRKMMRKTGGSYEMATCTSSASVHEPRGAGASSAVRGYSGVHIRGLEVTNNVCAEKTLQRSEVKSPVLTRSQSLSTPARTHTHTLTHGDTDTKTHSSSKIQHILAEMVSLRAEMRSGR
ncbi:hypothetical protein AALO_G00181000 [Alosa alosa]|uniref:Uncharacterized protein n=1 Tax=Alosa alosa TaxID=278164 RepID=A0AAV6GFF8_9TELE|nr:hypothetical protein AALO_G00181000 [Alosa alosa]